MIRNTLSPETTTHFEPSILPNPLYFFNLQIDLFVTLDLAFIVGIGGLGIIDVVIEKYSRAKINLDILHALGARLLYGVDARTMKYHVDLHEHKFDRIVYNFPHAGFFGKPERDDQERDDQVIRMHQDVVCSFFRNASTMLQPEGEVHISHKDTFPFNSWNVIKLARQSGLEIIERVEFKLDDYPGYMNKRGDGPRADEPFPVGESCTFKFMSSSATLYQRNQQEFPSHKEKENANLVIRPGPGSRRKGRGRRPSSPRASSRFIGYDHFQVSPHLSGTCGLVPLHLIDVVIEKYKRAKSNLDILHTLGARLLYGVDARTMKYHADLHEHKLDIIIFNFPHAGFLWKTRKR